MEAILSLLIFCQKQKLECLKTNPPMDVGRCSTSYIRGEDCEVRLFSNQKCEEEFLECLEKK